MEKAKTKHVSSLMPHVYQFHPTRMLFRLPVASLALALLCAPYDAQAQTSQARLSFEGHRVPMYTGRHVAPNFSTLPSARGFRTRIREASVGAPNFAGNMTWLAIGCGTRCLIYYLVNARTGSIFGVTFGGEDGPDELHFRPWSRLVVLAYYDDRFSVDYETTQRGCRVEYPSC